MLVFFFYMLKVIICSAILLGYYWLMLRNKIFHQYNRFYLLAAVVLSLVVPLVSIEIWHNIDKPAPDAIRLLRVVNSSDEYLDEIVLTARQNSFSSEQAFSFIYLLTSIIFLGAFVFALIKIRLLFIKNRHRLLGSIFFVNTTAKGTPFSFLRCIFWNDHIDPESTTGKQVFRHELAHVQQLHSYDKLFLNAVLIFAWCNPFFWLIRKELHMIHEFVADKIAVEDNDTEAFAAMILQAAYPHHRFQLSNPFFYSPIKRRLMMLTKNRNPKVGYIGRLLVLPLVIFIFAAFTLKSKSFTDKVPAYDGPSITVVIDPGHGGSDAGATGLNGKVAEKDLTLLISKKIRSLNSNSNINILLTRETDTYQTPGERVGFSKRNHADLFISLHLNPLQTGLEVLVSGNSDANKEQSDLLASALINAFNKSFQLPVSPQPKQPQQTVRVLASSECPAVLVEAGNISSEKDMAYLQNSGQDAIARNVLSAVERFAVSITTTNHHPQNVASLAIAPIKRARQDTIPKVVVKTKENALVIVDGKIVTQVELEKISPEVITSVNVIKDQEATRQYGEKGKNGVIVVTTQHVEPITTNLEINIRTDSIKINNTRLEKVKISSTTNVHSGKEPLYVLNGEVLNQPINLEAVDPGDIEKINVLKDKFATEKYGPEAVHGVVEIITKNGSALHMSPGTKKSGKPLDEVVVMGYGTKKDQQPGSDNKVFTRAETDPAFPGGDSAWKSYLIKNAKAEMPVMEGWKSGVYKIIVSFIVRKDGSVADVKTNDYPGSQTSEHCIDLIRNGPKWKPARQNGQPVNAYKKQPITFVVEEQNSL
jgi:N-acetylmuramoyl-L-alanine amidase